MKSKKIIFIVGPTAIGKSKIAFLLAKRVKGEIISCDSMQVYKEISILNNKPPKELMRSIAHHLIGVVSVSNNFDVAAFQKKVIAAVGCIHQKGKIPIIVGGSGLYAEVLLDGIFKGEKSSLGLRKRYDKIAKEKGNIFLHGKLKKIDPKSAGKIHPHDLRRVIRALEVFAANKKPISQMQRRSGLFKEYDVKIFALNCDRAKLYGLINKRVDQMFRQGALKEIKKLKKKRISRTARGIIGLKEIRGFLKGDYDLEQTKYLMKRNTRHFAKRQLTWFRKDKRLNWILVKNSESSQRVRDRIFAQIKSL